MKPSVRLREFGLFMADFCVVRFAYGQADVGSRYFECHIFYTKMISGEKELTPKSALKIASKLKLPHITVISKIYAKINGIIQIRKKYTKNLLTQF